MVSLGVSHSFAEAHMSHRLVDQLPHHVRTWAAKVATWACSHSGLTLKHGSIGKKVWPRTLAPLLLAQRA